MSLLRPDVGMRSGGINLFALGSFKMSFKDLYRFDVSPRTGEVSVKSMTSGCCSAGGLRLLRVVSRLGVEAALGRCMLSKYVSRFFPDVAIVGGLLFEGAESISSSSSKRILLRGMTLYGDSSASSMSTRCCSSNPAARTFALSAFLSSRFRDAAASGNAHRENQV